MVGLSVVVAISLLFPANLVKTVAAGEIGGASIGSTTQEPTSGWPGYPYNRSSSQPLSTDDAPRPNGGISLEASPWPRSGRHHCRPLRPPPLHRLPQPHTGRLQPGPRSDDGLGIHRTVRLDRRLGPAGTHRSRSCHRRRILRIDPPRRFGTLRRRHRQSLPCVVRRRSGRPLGSRDGVRLRRRSPTPLTDRNPAPRNSRKSPRSRRHALGFSSRVVNVIDIVIDTVIDIVYRSTSFIWLASEDADE